MSTPLAPNGPDPDRPPTAAGPPVRRVDRAQARSVEEDDLDARLAQFEELPEWTPRAGRRNAREKGAAGIRGIKHAFRGDSSFFVHAYRGLFLALTAALIGVGPLQWCLLCLGAALVLIAELNHSAVDTLARAHGDPDAPGPTAAREIASAGVLVSVVVFAAVAITILTLRFLQVFSQ